MKNYTLVFIHVACAIVLVTAACGDHENNKLRGEWLSADGGIKLKITNKVFTLNSGAPISEDYFVKEDTIYTSYEGNLPYSKFVVKYLDEHRLKLQYPDSALVVFRR